MKKKFEIGHKMTEIGNMIGSGYNTQSGFYDNVSIVVIEGCSITTKVEHSPKEMSAYSTSCPYGGSIEVEAERFWEILSAELIINENAERAAFSFSYEGENVWHTCHWNNKLGWDDNFPF